MGFFLFNKQIQFYIHRFIIRFKKYLHYFFKKFYLHAWGQLLPFPGN